MWIDIHAHLYEQSADELAQSLTNAKSKNVHVVVNAATNIETAKVVVGQCAREKNLFGVLGISPFDTEVVPEYWSEELKGLLGHPGIIGIGEMGLDNTNPIYPSLEKQIPIFEKQLEMAVDMNVPVVIHSRGAEGEAIEMCSDHKVSKALFHCFTGSRNQLKKLIDCGYYVSFSGIITFKNSPCDELVSYAPLDRLFIETDTPYLSPHPFRGKPNEPANVIYVGEKIAAIKGIPVKAVAQSIEDNFFSLFNISVSE